MAMAIGSDPKRRSPAKNSTLLAPPGTRLPSTITMIASVPLYASHLICSRSTWDERRYRTNSETGAAKISALSAPRTCVRVVTTSPIGPRTAKGFWMTTSVPPSGIGASAMTPSTETAAIRSTMVRSTQVQRPPSPCPVGKTSSVMTIRPSAGPKLTLETSAASSPPGSRPGSRTRADHAYAFAVVGSSSSTPARPRSQPRGLRPIRTISSAPTNANGAAAIAGRMKMPRRSM